MTIRVNYFPQSFRADMKIVHIQTNASEAEDFYFEVSLETQTNKQISHNQSSVVSNDFSMCSVSPG